MVDYAPKRSCRSQHGFYEEVRAWRLASASRSTQAADQQLGSSLELLYRAEAGSAEVARGPEGRLMRAPLKRAEQKLAILRKALVIFGQSTR